MRDLVDMGFTRYKFAVQRRQSVQLYLSGERVSWTNAVTVSISDPKVAVAAPPPPKKFCRPALRSAHILLSPRQCRVVVNVDPGAPSMSAPVAHLMSEMDCLPTNTVAL